MEELSFGAVLEDLMSGVLDDIIASLEGLAEAATQAGETLSAAFSLGAEGADVLAGSADAAAAATDALAASMDVAAASTDANTAAIDANTAASDAGSTAHGNFGAAAKRMVMPLGLATAAVVGIGAAAIHMAGDFQSGLTSLATGAGESASNLGMIHDGILQMSVATGESTTQLVNGMFMIESSGAHGAKALAELQAAAEGAKVGNADLGAMANALTTVLANYGAKGVTATQATNDLIQIVSHGKSHMQDLATSISTVLPSAAKYGVSLTDVSAALATMTAQNGDAASSTTYMKQLLTSLASPSASAQKSLKSIGLSAQQVSDDMKKSLPDTLQMITDHINSTFKPGSVAANEAFKNIAGGSRQMQGMLLLTGGSMSTFKQNAKDMAGAVKHGGNQIQGWSQVQKDFNQQMSQSGASLSTAMIKIGEALAPVATSILTTLNPALKWLGDHAQPVAIALGVLAVTLGGALVGALVAVAAAEWAVIAPALPFIAIAAAIALVIAGLVIAIIYLKTHWKQIGEWISGEWHRIMTAVGGWFSNLGTQAHKLWDQIASAFGGVARTIGGFFSGVGARIHLGWVVIQTLFHAGVAYVHSLVFGFVHNILGLFGWLFDHNYYFHALVVGIQREFLWIKTTAQTIWHDITSGLTSAWNHIKGYAERAFAYVKLIAMRDWMLVKAYIIEPVQHVVAQVQGRINQMKARLQVTWAAIVAEVQATWSRFLGIITSIGGRMGSAVQDNVVSPITRVMSNLLSVAGTWGHNLVQHLIDGIKNMAGAAGNAAKGIAGNIAAFLGFHSPTEEGPGAEADQWMPNLMKMLAGGMMTHAPLLGAAARVAAGQVAGILGAGGAGGGLGVGGGGLLPAGLLAGGAGGLGGGGGPTQVTVVLKDETGMGGFMAGARLLNPGVMQLLAQQIAKEMAAQGLLQGRQPISYTGSR